jgi:hypothetical protein
MLVARPLIFAAANYVTDTNVNLTLVTSGTTAWMATIMNFGADGYHGYATWNCFGTNTLSCDMWPNNYYLSGSEPQDQLKVVWAHETGHCLGLNHVAPVDRVMFESPSYAFLNAGVTALTFDEINDINSLYN